MSRQKYTVLVQTREMYDGRPGPVAVTCRGSFYDRARAEKLAARLNRLHNPAAGISVYARVHALRPVSLRSVMDDHIIEPQKEATL